MLNHAVLAADSNWLTLAWPILLLFLLIGWLLHRIVSRILFGPPADREKKLHHRPYDSTETLPDAWAESARRLKVDDANDEDADPRDDSPPSDPRPDLPPDAPPNRPNRPQQPPQ